MNTSKNMFQDFQQKKAKICRLAGEALKSGWLEKVDYDNIIDKIIGDKLTIGVIGQMKCGKSTFLNAFLFGKQLLPAATTPMTAALSVITYGEKSEIVAEFYTKDEWEELKLLASRDVAEVSDLQTKSSIKAAAELYEKSHSIKSQIPSLLGKTQHDDFSNLIDYVGADGKYVSIVKSVKLFLPEEWLKGVEIVDTPGFNDPVISREERTKDFLKHADVVLLMLYAGRAFDATDRDILFDKVRRVGVGKIILAVNKYDIQIAQGESPEQIKENVKDEIKKAMYQIRDESINELLADLDPVLISAQLALMAKMPMSLINADRDLKYHFDKACDDFELTNQHQLLGYSRIGELEDKVKDIIVNQKEKILIEKPKNLIFAKAKNAIDNIDEALTLLNQKKEELSLPDKELDDRIVNLEKAQRRIERKVENAETDLAEVFDEVSIRFFREIQDLADNTKCDCDNIIDNYKREELSRKLKNRLELFETREFPRKLEDIKRKLQKAFDDNLHQLSDDIENVLRKYIDDSDEITESFVRAMKKSLDVEIGNYINNVDSSSKEESISGLFIEVLSTIISTPFGFVGNIYDYFEGGRKDARETVDKYFHSIDWEGLKVKMKERKSKFISALGGKTAKDLIAKLLEQANEARGTKEEKEKALRMTKAEIASKKEQLSKITNEFNNLKTLI